MKLPLGYRYATLYAGIRKAKKDDLALIVSDKAATCAGVFTQNRVQAAPVRLSKAHLRQSRGMVKALLINAGNANCATRTGEKVALASCKAAARALRAPVEQILPSSTGVIGVELDAKKITLNLASLVGKLTPDGFAKVSEAIMTTDTRPKVAFAEVVAGKGTVTIAGMTKGAGMIQPLMATTLGYILTDAAIPTAMLKELLVAANEVSYNRISVDGDTSTNDTVLLLANGASGQKLGPRDRDSFAQALTHVMQDLAKQIVRDGEGAKKLITIQVEGTKSDDDAARIARGIANSPLVKTAIAGSDPNWGRIISAGGNAGVAFDPGKVDIYLQGKKVCAGGLATKMSEEEMTKKLDAADVSIRFVIKGSGRGQSKFWTCDFTEGYIQINGSYRT